MTSYLRRQQIVEIIRTEPDIRIPEIALRLSVSQGTIRNDLNILAESGQIVRVHGGAVIIETTPSASPTFKTRAQINADLKERIAQTASRIVQNGDSIFLDASTTVYAMARCLQEHRDLRVITNGIEVARLLAANLTNTVILLGGILRPDGASITGSLSEKFLTDLHIGSAFVSCSGFIPDIGLTEIDIQEVQLKENAINSSTRVFALVDSSKFGKADLTPFARPQQIDLLITDYQISQEWIMKFQQTGIDLLISDEKFSKKE